MITPVAFATIQYQTYIIFAVINAFIVPVVYFFYPETAYRSLEEMDDIFRKTKGVFSVVHDAKPSVTPNRYDKKGHLLVNYLETDEHLRRSSATPHEVTEKAMQDKQRSANDEAYTVEGGFAESSSHSSSR